MRGKGLPNMVQFPEAMHPPSSSDAKVFTNEDVLEVLAEVFTVLRSSNTQQILSDALLVLPLLIS